MDPDQLDQLNVAARYNGPTIRRVNPDGSVTVLREESEDPSGQKAAAKSTAILAAEQDAIDSEEAEADLVELEAEQAEAAADAAADAEAAGEGTPIDLGGEDDDVPEPIDLDNMSADPYRGQY